MSEGDRVQLGWEVSEDTWAAFQEAVRETWGAVSPFTNRALEDAICGSLGVDVHTVAGAHAQSIEAVTDYASVIEQHQDLLSQPPDPDQSRITVWTSVHVGLKDALASVADEHDYQKWVLLTAVVRSYTSGETTQQGQEQYSSDAPASAGRSKERVATEQDSLFHRGPDSNTMTLTWKELPSWRTPTFEDYLPQDWNPSEKSISGSSSEMGDELETVVTEHELVDWDVDQVLTRLPGGDEGFPRPFHQDELYRTAADIDIRVWSPIEKDLFRTRLLDRIDYEWKSGAGRYAPVLGETLIETITTAAEAVETALGTDLSQSLQEDIDEWSAIHGFDETSENPDRLIARQAVFNLLLKATLYEWYHKNGDLASLPPDIRGALQRAQKHTDNPAFGEYVLDEVVWLADMTTLIEVVNARHRVVRSAQPTTDIGRLYEILMPRESRGGLDQHWTPENIKRLMRKWAIDDGDTVLDPGMGAGALSGPRRRHSSSALEPSQIVGIDRSQLAVVMGTTALTLARQSTDTRTTDFLDMSPKDIREDINAVVCNPPYTRHKELSSEYKRSLNDRFERETGLDISLTSPLYAYFYYHLGAFLAPGDRASVITPHSFLTADYGESLKQYLLETFDIKALVLFDPRSDPVFDNVLTTSLIAFLEARDQSDDPGLTRFIRINENLNIKAVLDALQVTDSISTEWGFIDCVPQEKLEPEQDWERYFKSGEADTGQLVSLSDIAEVTRGLSTGENDFFCLTDSEVADAGLDERYLARIVRSPRTIQGYDIRMADWETQRDDDNEVWLLYHLSDVDGVPDRIPDGDSVRSEPPAVTDERDSPPTALAEYLWSGLTEHETLAERTVIQNRSPWYRVERREPAPILITSLTRSEFRALLNEATVRHLNNLYGVYPTGEFTETETKALLAYLNSGFVDTLTGQYERTLAGGLRKFEPSDVEEIPVIDPREVRDEVVATLADRFDSLREAARQNESVETILGRIDAILEEEFDIRLKE